ncbi:hypothetical protein SAMN02745163_02157 [Clostridium cavendishii DSM 21758]|uniref:Uncharacterized protein n=1 Tax=Clostridium cavendishii DSM 21758 TaxID=1121302 RepID=A0A1M6KCI2_9CLOT|nr:hypothetical protein [Clostridium cavendishii]SHJ56628.1 hypothetical protein SAMN02745163_02157 [Clostridium cavendishii DSM 21758]
MKTKIFYNYVKNTQSLNNKFLGVQEASYEGMNIVNLATYEVKEKSYNIDEMVDLE